MQPMDTHGREILATERFERLRRDAQPPVAAAGRMRVRFGGLLIATGLRFAPEASQPNRVVSRGAAAPSAPGRARAARPG
jgi:hypothetical protein